MEDNKEIIVENKLSNEGIKIIEYSSKYLLQEQFGIVTKYEPACSKYYFANEKGERLSKDYYSIEQIDNYHFLVVELDFIYSQDFESWDMIYGKEQLGTNGRHLRFHRGVVTIKDGKVIEVVPAVYNMIKLTNSKMLFVYGCDKIITLYNEWPKQKYIPDKLGCINLDPESESYGLITAPCLFTSITDFDLEYEGYAHAYIYDEADEEKLLADGYISKIIDEERYKKLVEAFNKLGCIRNGEYKAKVLEAVSHMLYTKDEVEHKLIEQKEPIKLVKSKEKNQKKTKDL